MQFKIDISKLPASTIAEEVNRQLDEHACLVVTASPGAGKSTLLPLTLLDGLQRRSGAEGTTGKVLVLEPRRVAARQIAMRMASMLGEAVGETVGYRIRFENCVSQRTRVEVVTEGILTRMLMDDPTLDGIDVVVFDEFHERNLHSDVALALCQEAQQLIRPDLKLVVMSATIDTALLCDKLNAPCVGCEGRMFPVEVKRAKEEATLGHVAEAVARCILEAHRHHQGDILAFLPGQADILRCRDMLEGALGDTSLCMLYGQLSPQEQQRAIAPSKEGERKVVLATNIAETSLTIEDVRVVVDSGWYRTSVFDERTGLSHLETVPISLDMAVQRSGRAGRVAEGVCYRLWNLGAEHRMAEHRTPEILSCDMASTLLSLAVWQGGIQPSTVLSMPWITPPPTAKLYQAQQLLSALGALDDGGRLTEHGRRLAALPCHPRIAQMLVGAEDDTQRVLAADIAALLEEKDMLSSPRSAMQDVAPDSDLNTRVMHLCEARERHALRQWERIERVAAQYRSLLRLHKMVPLATLRDAIADDRVGALLALAYPERVAQCQRDGSYLMANGNVVRLAPGDCLTGHEWLAVASAQASGRIFLAAPVQPVALQPLLRTIDNVQWDSRKGAVVAQCEQRLGRIVVSSRPLQDVAQEQLTALICQAAVKDGLSMFDFNDEVQQLQRRVATVSAWHPELEYPSLATDDVLREADKWLPFYLGRATTAVEFRKIPLTDALLSLLSYEQQQTLDRLAPTHLVVPTGSRIKVEYRQGAELPVLRVRLQECFGLVDTPRVDDGARAVLMELLSPGFKPVQLTTDLASFWTSTYFEVRKELRRRYPKHYWPDNPLEAEPTRGVKR